MNKFLNKLVKKQSLWKANLLLPFLSKNEKVLDFGGGDLSLAKTLKKKIPSLQISGVDVVDFPERPKNIPLVVYDGKKLPFKNNSFDTVISFYVFHHCNSAEKSFAECLRVAKKRVIIGESIPRYRLEIPVMKFLDWLTNVWKSEDVPLPYEFYSLEKWRKIFKKYHIKNTSIKPFGNSVLSLLPMGGQYVIEVEK